MGLRNALVVFFIVMGSVAGWNAYGYIVLYGEFNKQGYTYQGSPSQILPGSYITFYPDIGSLANASMSNPVILDIHLPLGAVLSQTLATGTRFTNSPLPTNGEKIIDLAVSEYSFPGGGTLGVTVEGKAAGFPAIDPHAVQLFRYVAGEDTIQIRVQASTQNWISSSPSKFIGFTIGVGGGVLPNTTANNWGADGMYTQLSTLLQVDLRGKEFSQQSSSFFCSLSAHWQATNLIADVGFIPGEVNLMRWMGYLPGPVPVTAVVGGEVTDSCLADLNRDNLADFISVDRTGQRLYWAYGSPDGGFHDLDWRGLDFRPVTVNAADITGDSLPDVLIADEQGLLHILEWSQLFAPVAQATKTAEPGVALFLAGVPAAAILRDVDADGNKDFLYLVTGVGVDNLNILFGKTFSSTTTYVTDNAPIALCSSDFDGDGDPDVAVANNLSNSVSVFWNRKVETGTFSMSKADLAGVGSQPVGIAAADFDRNGKVELALALQGDKALAIFKLQHDGLFHSAQTPIYFLDTPSALMTGNFDGLEGPDVLLGYSDYYKLALCTSDAAGLLHFAYNLNTLSDVDVDPFGNVTMPESGVVAVSDATYGGVSDLSGVAGVTQQPFNVIHFPRSKDLSFAVVNLSAGDALLNMELYDNAGKYKAANTQSIASGAQFAIYFTDPSIFGNAADFESRWVRGFLTQPETYGLWLANNGTDLSYLDGTKIPDITDARDAFLFSNIKMTAGGSTQFYLINPSTDAASVTLKLISRYGVEKATQVCLLDGRSRIVLDALTLFPSLAEEDYVKVSSDVAIIGLELFGDSQKLASLPGLDYAASQGNLYCPHVAVGDLGGVQYESILTILNLSGVLQHLAAYLYSDNGTLLASNTHVDIGANQKQIRNVKDVFSLTTATTGYVKIVPAAGSVGVTGSISFGELTGGRFLSALPLQTETHHDYVMGHLASGTIDTTTYYTGFSLFNPDDTFKFVEVTAYDKDGVEKATRAVTLQNRQRLVFLLDQFMPELGPIFGGYIVIDQTDLKTGYYVFELFGDLGFNFLSTVPAIPID